MSIIDLLHAPWAILPDSLIEIQQIYAMHLRGERVDLASVEARLGRPLANEPKPYEVRKGVAIVPVHGVIAPKASMFMDISGGVSAQRVAAMFDQAAADPDVKAIIQYQDSPGGAVQGTPEAAAAARRAGQAKPLVTFSDGQMASASYWMGSAGQRIFVSGPTVDVGSIGVVSMHRDFSGQEERAGVKTTEVTAGKYKRITSQYEPLSKAGRAHMQERVDYLYSLFVNVVAEHRGVSVERVLSDMADGRVFIGQQAIDAGLVDGFMSLDELVDRMAVDPLGVVKPPSAGRSKAITATTTSGASAPDFTSEGATMSQDNQPTAAALAAAATQAISGLTREGLQTGNPALFAALQADFKAAGAAAELSRIKDVQAQSMRGHEKLINELMFDGKTTGPEAAVKVLEAHRAEMAKAGDQHFSDAPAAAASGAAAAAQATTAKSRDDMAAEAQAYANEHKVTFVQAWKQLGFDGN